MTKEKERLAEARKEHNQWALMVDSEYEKPITDKLTLLCDERDRISKEILNVITKHFGAVIELTAKIEELQTKDLYNISGEWGIDNFIENRKDKALDKYFDLLYDLTEGMVVGYNLTEEGIKEYKTEFKNLGLPCTNKSKEQKA